MQEQGLTSCELASRYMVRLALYENRLDGAIAVYPRALEETARGGTTYNALHALS